MLEYSEIISELVIILLQKFIGESNSLYVFVCLPELEFAFVLIHCIAD